MTADKPHRDDLYPEYHTPVTNQCRKFLWRLPDEELQDLSQSCWEEIISKYTTFNPAECELSLWIHTRSRDKLYAMLRILQTEREQLRKNTVSLNGMADESGRYL